MGASSVARVRSSRSILSFGLLAVPVAVVAIAACGGAPPPEAPAPVAAPPPPPPPPPPAPEPVAEKPAAAPAAPAPAAAPDLLKCTEMVEAPDGTIDDAEDGDAKTAVPGMWTVGADDKGSKVEPDPKAPVTMAKGGADNSKMAFHAKGKTATGDGAWGVNMGPELGPAFDASKYAGISFWAKVGPKSTKVVRFNVMDAATVPQGNVCTQSCWNHFGKELPPLDGKWKKITIAFSELAQQDGWGDPHPPHVDASKLYGLKWAVPAGQDFDIWIDQVKFLKCK